MEVDGHQAEPLGLGRVAQRLFEEFGGDLSCFESLLNRSATQPLGQVLVEVEGARRGRAQVWDRFDRSCWDGWPSVRNAECVEFGGNVHTGLKTRSQRLRP